MQLGSAYGFEARIAHDLKYVSQESTILGEAIS